MSELYDVVIAGGGPAGCTAGLVLARAGFRVCILEKDQHPRFHIGESILPRNTPLLHELGLSEALNALPRVAKFGAEFGFGNDFTTRTFQFTDGLLPGFPVFNIERSVFDEMLSKEARSAGAEVFENSPLDEVLKMGEGQVEVRSAGRVIRGRVLLDASGHGTVVGRHVGSRRTFDEPELQKVAYFQHFEGVERHAGDLAGHPTLLMCDEGWFWLIAINATTTSVGFVSRPSFVRTLKVPPDRLLSWAIERCPVARHRMRHAKGPHTNHVMADFSYTCAPFAGPGYFLIGDAACFLDPIFSTGVTLAMMSAQACATNVAALLRGEVTWARAQAEHCRFVTGSTSVFWRLIRLYYRHSFRELFMNARGPMNVHGAIISILAGQVFPKPIWPLRWRMRLFEALVEVNEHFAIVPRRNGCSLLDDTQSLVEHPPELTRA